MGKFLSRIASPTALLYLFLIIVQVVKGIYVAADAKPPPAFTLLCALGFLWVVS